ncbi:MAG: class I SAM-dependent methyltransferase, partial [Candidatus Heimdallarchaeaceae archaeon]
MNFHSQLTPEDKVDFQDTQMKWEEISKNWNKGKTSRQSTIDPAFWKVLDDVQGLRVLDAGCGSGYFARKLAKKGANVYGVDFSEKVVEYCKKREEEEQLGCKFSQASLTNLDMFENDFFDLIVSNIVLMGVQDYLTVFLEIRHKSGDVNFHSQLTPEDKVDFQDTQMKWEEISKNW